MAALKDLVDMLFGGPKPEISRVRNKDMESVMGLERMRMDALQGDDPERASRIMEVISRRQGGGDGVGMVQTPPLVAPPNVQQELLNRPISNVDRITGASEEALRRRRALLDTLGTQPQ